MASLIPNMEALTSPIAILTGGAVFFLVVSIWWIVTTLVYMGKVREEERLAARLNPYDTSQGKAKTLRLWHDGKLGTTTVIQRTSPNAVVRTLAHWAGALNWRGPLVLLGAAVLGAAILGFLLIYAFTRNPLLALAWAVGLPAALNVVAGRRAVKHAERFEQQLADALGLAARSLRAGHPLMSAFQVIVDEMEPPVSTTFSEIVQQQQLGTSLEEAIIRTADRSHSDDMKLFAASTVIQMRSGGNLADMMERLVAVIRDRIRLHRRARVLTAQTQLSKRVLIFMPFVMIALLMLTKPDYLVPMWETVAGRVMVGMAAGMLIIGSWMMNRIATLRY